MHEEIKRRREERIRRILADPRLHSEYGHPAGEEENGDWRSWAKPPTARQFAGKILLCLALYAGVWAVFQIEHPVLDPARAAIRKSLTESFDFAAASGWYHRHVGDLPAMMPAFGRKEQEAKAVYAMPVSGRVIEPYRHTGGGLLLSTPPGEEARASGEGLVIRVSETADTGLTVTVRHKGGLETIYGLLENVKVREFDWLAAGEAIGSVANDPAGGTGRFYFAVKQDGRFVDPRDVIDLD